MGKCEHNEKPMGKYDILKLYESLIINVRTQEC